MADAPTAGDVMTEGVIAIDEQASVQDAARKMRDEHIRSLVVTDNGEAVGILVGHDILYGVVSKGRDPEQTTVRDVMSENIVTATESDLVSDIARSMLKYNISRVPVLRGDQVVGIVTQSNILNTWPAYVDLLQEESHVYQDATGGTSTESVEYVSGQCDACENYSDELQEVAGELLCPVCREEQ